MKASWNFRVWGFVAVVYLVSGLLWAPILLSGEGMSSPFNMALMALITFVPSASGIVFTRLVQDRQGRRDFWRRAWRFPAVSKRVIIGALLVCPVLNLTAYYLAHLWEGKVISFDYARTLLSSAPMLLEFFLIEIVFGPLSEELGWRGYLLDEMQSRWGGLKSALVLGMVWGAWHTPAFLAPGLAQYEMGGILSLPYFSFVSGAVMGSILHTWVYNHTGRSTLLAGILMHFMANASMAFLTGTFDRFTIPGIYFLISPVLYLLVSVLVVRFWRLAGENHAAIPAALKSSAVRT